MIAVKALSKKFKLYRHPGDRLKELVTGGKHHTDLQALDDVTFTVADGETLGIIGQNGAGKTTLLKILSGILLQDSGTVATSGTITGLLELGTGFNAELTGIENIYLNGILLGMKRRDIGRRLDAIIEFSELGAFVYERLKTYSSGMAMRLAFAVAIHAEPKCLVVDEALSVGDAYFQQKCMRKIGEFRNSGGTILFVSHDMNAVKTLCDRAVLLDHGKIIESGKTADVADRFFGMMLQKANTAGTRKPAVTPAPGSMPAPGPKQVVSNGDAELVLFRIADEAGKERSHITSEDSVAIEYHIKARRFLEAPHYGIAIKNSLGVSLFETNTYCMNMATSPLEPGDIAVIRYHFVCDLAPGDYAVCIGVSNKGYGKSLFEDYSLVLHDAGMLRVTVNERHILYGGVYNMKPAVSIQTLRHAARQHGGS